MTMTFVVMGLGTVFNTLTNRRDPVSGLTAPILKAAAISVLPVVMIVLATQLPTLASGLLTQPLTGREWLACVGLALLLPVVIEANKWIQRRRLATPAPPGHLEDRGALPFEGLTGRVLTPRRRPLPSATHWANRE